MEAADDDGCLIAVGAFDVVGSQQDDARIPVVAIDAHIHAPLVHRLVPDHVGCPLVARNVVLGTTLCTTACRPLDGVKVVVVFLAALLHLRHLR